MEIWKSIAGFENYYEVSTLGNVRSAARVVSSKNQHGICKMRIKPRLLKPGKNNHGYMGVVLYKDGKKKTYSVHRLVAIAFIPNPHKYRVVNHKNGVKHDNRANNLEWCNNEENQRHAYENNLAKPSYGNAKLTEEQVREIRRLYFEGKLAQSEIARRFSVYKTLVNKIVHYKTWKNI